MAASFPNAKKTFTQIVDGTTKVEAVNANVVYDEVEAVQTFIGAMGSTQANTDSIKNLNYNYKRGCRLAYDSATQFTVTAGEIAIPDASGNMRLRRNTSNTTVTWADIDTGSEATSTIYYVYARADSAGTTFTVIISTNSTTPTGATFYRKIGAIYNDGSGNITKWVSYSSGIGVIPVISSFTLDVSTTGDEAFDMNLGFTPSLLEFQASVAIASASFGQDNGFLAQCTYYNANTSLWTADLTKSIHIVAAAGDVFTGVVKTMDASGFTLTKAKTGSPTGTLTVLVKAHQ